MPDSCRVRDRAAVHGVGQGLQGPAARDAGGELSEPRITLITRVDCHLCDEARAAVRRVAATAGVGYAEVDVASSVDLSDRYADQVPVVLVDGREHGYWTVEEDRLLRALTVGRWPWSAPRR